MFLILSDKGNLRQIREMVVSLDDLVKLVSSGKVRVIRSTNGNFEYLKDNGFWVDIELGE